MADIPEDLMQQAIEDITRKVMEQFHCAIDARLRALVVGGISVNRIRIEQHPDGTTAIVVDNVPNSTFRIEYLNYGHR